MNRLVKILVSLLIVLYPISVYYGLNYWQPKMIGLVLVGLMLLRLLVQWKQLRKMPPHLLATAVLGLLIGLSVFGSNNLLLLKLYPSLISLSLLIVFSISLWQSQTIVEKIARISEPELSPSGVLYTRNVTKVWCVFFIINGGISLYTSFFTSFETWTLYNGLLSYFLIGLLFSVEYSVRQVLRKRGLI